MRNKLPKNPYPGLRPFEFAENHLFFGREGQSEEVLRRLQESRFLAVVGTSGSGKSSLVRAGLLPLLYGGFMTEAGASWRVALFRPGDNPIHNLAEALVHPTQFTSSKNAQSGNSVEDENLKLAVTETVLRRSAVGLRDFANSNEFAEDENLLVVVDQFEELFRFKKENQSQIITEKSERQENAENEAAAFVKLLIEATKDKTRRVYVVITMRSDFLGDCSQFRDLPETINNGQYLIPRLTTEQLRKAIESPAKVKGARIQPALVARLLNDIGDDQDQLPVLQHALMRTWDKWAEEGNRDAEINFDHYNATGGMATALSEHADEAFFELGSRNPEEFTRKQQIAEKLFKCLTETDRENRETRRATTIGKICKVADASKEEVSEVIETFRQPGRTFLMPPQTEILDENTLIDISHESLIRKWDRLKTWVEEESQAAQTYRRLAEDALLHKDKLKGFWGDPELKNTLEWKEKFKPNETWSQLYKEKGERTYRASFDETMQYLDDSRNDRDSKIARERRQRILLATLSALFFITTLMAGYMAYRASQSANEANIQKIKAEQQTEEVAKQKDIAETEKNKALNQTEIAQKATKKAVEQTNIADEKTKLANEQTIIAEDQKKRANKEAENAKTSQAETQEAFTVQKSLRDDAEEARLEAVKGKDEAVVAKNKADKLAAIAVSLNARELDNREALILLEQGNNEGALEKFKSLLNGYKQDVNLLPKGKSDGFWWTNHNLGIASSRLGRFSDAKSYFNEAIISLGEQPVDENSINGLLSPHRYFFQNVSYQTNTDKVACQDIETCIRTATSLRRLAQLYRGEARNQSDDNESQKLNKLALKSYDQLFVVLNLEKTMNLGRMEKTKNYPIDAYIEKADTLVDLRDDAMYQSAQELYESALEFYKGQSNYIKQVEILKKQWEAANKMRRNKEAVNYLLEAIKIQENELSLKPLSLELADSYKNLSQTFTSYYASENNDNTKLGKADYYKWLSEKIFSLDIEFDRQRLPSWDGFTNLAQVYINEGNCNRAERVYNFAFENIRKVNSSSDDEINIIGKLADFYQGTKQDNINAKKYFDALFVKFTQFNPNDKTSEVGMTLADYYYETKDYDKSIFINNKLLPIFKNKVDKFRNSQSPNSFALNDVMHTVITLANSHSIKNNEVEAEAKYKEAIKIAEVEQNDIHNNSENSGIDTAEYYFYLANFYFQHGKVDQAKQTYQKVLILYMPMTERYNPNSKDSNAEIINIEVYISSLKKLGNIEEKGNPSLAKSYYENAIKWLDLLKNNSSLYNSSGLWVSDYFSKKLYLREDFNSSYYKDYAEILESWSKLLERAEANSKQDLASKTRKLAEERLNKEENLKKEQEKSKPQCKSNQ